MLVRIPAGVILDAVVRPLVRRVQALPVAADPIRIRKVATTGFAGSALRQCVAGQSVCVGAIVHSTEVCDGTDNDCNGLVDTDTLGFGNNCTGSGVFTLGECRAKFQCPGGMTNPSSCAPT